mgnify:CR=1 FL=1
MIEQFLKSGWYKKARTYAYQPKKLKALAIQLGFYISKEGLSGVKENLVLMYHYILDIATGKYKDYNVQKLIIVVAALIYVVSPLDFFPDVLPLGLMDDVSIIGWAMKEVSEELQKYKMRKAPDTAIE